MAACGIPVAFLQPSLALARSAPSDLSGRYHYAGGEHEQTLVEKAIEDAISGMNLLIRAMARSRLAAAVKPRPALEFDFGANHVTFRSPGLPKVQGSLDGRPFSWTNQEGEIVTVRCRLQGWTLRMRYQGDGGDSLCEYQFDETEPRLRMRARIDHVRLPATLRYGLSYRRSES